MHIGAPGQLGNAGAPLGKDRVAAPGIGADPDRPADMVEHDRRLGKRARQIDELAELGVVHPRVEAEAERVQPGKPLAHRPVHQESGGAVHRGAARGIVGVRGRDEADPAKPSAAGHDHRLEHRLDPRPEREIGIADDAGADLGLAIGAARRHRRDAVGELDLANRAPLGGAAGAVHRQPFEVDRRGDVVPGAGIGQEIGQQVAPGILAIDQVMMRVDDR